MPSGAGVPGGGQQRRLPNSGSAGREPPRFRGQHCGGGASVATAAAPSWSTAVRRWPNWMSSHVDETVADHRGTEMDRPYRIGRPRRSPL